MSVEADFSRKLYSFPVFGAGKKVERLVLPVPTEEMLHLFEEKIGCVDTPTPLTDSQVWLKWLSAPPVKPAELAHAYDAFANLIGMKVTIVDSLIKTMEIVDNLRLKHALACIISDMTAGSSASEAFAKHEKIFDQTSLGQIQAGEKTAKLAETFKVMAAQIQLLTRVREQSFIAMIYPAGVVASLYVIVSAILYFLMPRLAAAFTTMQLKLPVATQVLIAGGQLVNHNPFVLLAGPIAVGFLWMIRGLLARPITFFLRKAPIFGSYYLQSQLARNVSTLAALLQSGILLPEAVGLVAATNDDPALRNSFIEAKQALEEGDNASVAFGHVYDYFGRVANTLKAAVEVGNSANSLPITLQEAAVSYQRSFVRASEIMQKIIEPLATIFVGLVVSAITMAGYFPILTATQQLK